MIYLYDNAIADDLKESFNPDHIANPYVKVYDAEEVLNLAAQMQDDDITYPVVALTRVPDTALDTTLVNFTRLHGGTACVFDNRTNTYYNERAIPIKLSYKLTIITTNTADMDELTRELIFKYVDTYFLTIQLPYESNRKVRFGIKYNFDAGIDSTSTSANASKQGKLYQSILTLDCEGAVLVHYNPVKLTRISTEVEASSTQ